jgi:hypothetical protein
MHHRFLVVVRPLHELRPLRATGAAKIRPERHRIDVVDRAAVRAAAAARDAARELHVVHFHQHDRGERLPDFRQHRVERVGLREVARETVEDVPGGGIRLREAFADHAEHDAVVDELAGLHRILRRDAQRRAAFHRGTQQIAGGDLRDAETLDETLGLSALPGTGGTKQNYTHGLCNYRRY